MPPAGTAAGYRPTFIPMLILSIALSPATLEAAFGGGLYCYIDSFVHVIDSIIWGNTGNVGSVGTQIALDSADSYYPAPSTVKVTYSDILDATNPFAFGAKVSAVDLVFAIDSTGSMGDDIAAVKAAAVQLTNEVATKIPDFRMAVVDYRDFNQPYPPPNTNNLRYGDVNDFPYRTDTAFTRSTSAVVAAINSITALGGADTPESVYTALMHCIDHNSLRARLDPNYYGANPAWRGPGDWRSGNVLRVIILMGDAPPHDPEPFSNYGLADVVNAANNKGPIAIVPVLIGQDPLAYQYYWDLANQTGGTVVWALTAAQVVQSLMTVIDLISRIPDPIFVDTDSTLNWSRSTFQWSAGSHNIDANPLFVNGFYLSQIAAGQAVNSPAVDKGHVDANHAGFYRHTTRTDSVIEDLNSPVDMGYHYILTSDFIGDLNFDGIVSLSGLDPCLLFRHWLDETCHYPDWCQGADLNMDGIVNNLDLAIFGQHLGESETVPPVPNPMTWEIMPYSQLNQTWAKMTATQARDAYGGQIQYYIQRTNDQGVPDGFYRNWDPNRSFTNTTGLVNGQTYGYRVKARDIKGNETGWSIIGLVKVGVDSPPNPPINLLATAVSQSQINLAWTDASSNENGFKIERRSGTGAFTQIATVGANVTTYNNTGLAAATTYTYHVRCL